MGVSFQMSHEWIWGKTSFYSMGLSSWWNPIKIKWQIDRTSFFPSQTPHVFFDISFLADLKLKTKSINKPWHYHFKWFFILRFWHRRHFHCLKLCTYHESKHEISKLWMVRQILLKTTIRGKLHCYQTPPEKWGHLTNNMWLMTHNMKRMSQSISELMR